MFKFWFVLAMIAYVVVSSMVIGYGSNHVMTMLHLNWLWAIPISFVLGWINGGYVMPRLFPFRYLYE